MKQTEIDARITVTPTMYSVTGHKISIFFLTAAATTEIYTLSLHDALPICAQEDAVAVADLADAAPVALGRGERPRATGAADRKSTRLNSSHGYISYAVFCLKKKKQSMRL